eukprot:7220592-Pyramimonas_sp.AAC.3
MPLSFAEWKRSKEAGLSPNGTNDDLGATTPDSPGSPQDCGVSQMHTALKMLSQKQASFTSSNGDSPWSPPASASAVNGWGQVPSFGSTKRTSEDKPRRPSGEDRRKSQEWVVSKEEEFGGVSQMTSVDPTFLERSLLKGDKADKWALEPPTRRSSMKRVHLRRNRTAGSYGSVRVG